MRNLFLEWVHTRMSFNKSRAFLVAMLLWVGAFSQPMADQIQVVAITQDFASIAQEIGGDLVEVQPLIKGSRNLHHVTPRPSMVMKVKRADLLIRLGMGQDSWIDGLIQVARNARVFPGEHGYLDASVPIRKLEIPDHDLDGSMGDVHQHGNPHYWLDPYNGVLIAAQIRDHLSQLSPENRSEFEANYQRFSTELERKAKVWNDQLLAVKSQIFITYHKA